MREKLQNNPQNDEQLFVDSFKKARGDIDHLNIAEGGIFDSLELLNAYEKATPKKQPHP